ncbi:PEP/pyruvate-binding domain-containing protein [Saccharopolyspora erythraea]|uniref:Pyruvate, water dikinase n=2 Tax=Saccharopolyspora erythraea TaxID=1836 RepID=A4F6R2_SACEN|nr:PEP/pyruvate-binding domain-containing protein [Saccharopolyspora erythraea]EQD87271.1 phosphoenolpyruvate synthase [Saccharopolyspora erythraea D]CAL99736.1 pyruvate, water dikinase [Saccharopolyspora erythraea NRRL 2338]
MAPTGGRRRHEEAAMSTVETTTGQVLDLSRIDAGMGEVVGGKAANLGELLAAGVRVPPGFCLTTRAYDEVCAAAVGDALDGLPSTAAEIRDRLTGVEMPAALADTVTTAYAALGDDVPVAVRSSATAEDLPHASFAGQQDTYLNVIGASALLDAVRRCWASLWTDRAVAYREANGIDHRAVKLAVVVQRMVDAQVSGVLFTANPVTGNRGETVVDANTGLGESVVSGAVNPDHFVVDTATGAVLTRQLGDKAVSVRPKPGGGTETVAGNGSPTLDDDALRALTAAGAAVQRHYGAPQDIEWAVDAAGTLWVTQARPVTTLFPLPAERRDGVRAYFSVNVAQGVYRPLTPMGAAVLRGLGVGFMRRVGLPVDRDSPPVWRQAGGWVFFDITDVVRHPVGRRVLPKLLAMMEVRTGKVVDGMLDDPRFAVRRGSSLPLLRRFAGIAARLRVPVAVARTLASPASARAHASRVADEIRRELARPHPSGTAERLAHARRVVPDVVVPRVAGLIPKLFTGMSLSKLMPSVLGPDVTAEEAQILLRGIPHNVTTEMDLELWRLAQSVEPGTTAEELAERYREGRLPGSVQAALESFFDRHGHRAVAEIDAGMPRWADDPTQVLGLVANYVSSAGGGHAADEQYRLGVAEAEAKAAEVVGRLRRTSPLRARAAAFTIDRIRGIVGIREMPKYCMVLGVAHVRRALRAVGADLVASGRLDAVDDVFFLDFDEVEEAVTGADLRGLVTTRRGTHERELRRRHLPRLLLSDGTEPEAAMLTETADGVLTGTSASAGTITGPAKVVRDPVGVELAPGEILVAPSTDPGWTPLFLTAGGLVMEMGGPNSHGATVAREYGIPAVVGVPAATERIRTGDRITVDGSAGTVELPGAAEESAAT